MTRGHAHPLRFHVACDAPEEARQNLPQDWDDVMNLTDYLSCTESDEKRVPNANEPGDGDRLYRFNFGAYGETCVDVFADSPDDAFEVAVGWLDDNAPGHLIELGAEDYKRAADELKLTYDADAMFEGDAVQEEIREHAEADLTQIGHTTLQHGQFVASWWTFSELEPKQVAK